MTAGLPLFARLGVRGSGTTVPAPARECVPAPKPELNPAALLGEAMTRGHASLHGVKLRWSPVLQYAVTGPDGVEREGLGPRAAQALVDSWLGGSTGHAVPR